MKIFLCDDNQQALDYYGEKLHELANKHDQELIIRTFRSGAELLFHFEDEEYTVDAVYLDIHMPGLDGVEVAECLKQKGFCGEIVFVTISEKHFLPAFDVGAFNYIVKKQTTDQRFEEIFLKIMAAANNRKKEYILVNSGGAHRRIEVENIYYFEVRKRIVTIFYKEGTFEFISTMDKLEHQLLGRGFLKVNRSYLVSIDAIHSATYKSITLLNGDEVPIGRSYQKEVHSYLKNKVS